MNAVLFQSTGSKTFYVHVKEISPEVRKVPYDLWNGSRFLFGKDLFPDKLKDFGGTVLKCTTFNFQPYTYQNEDGEWAGWEYQIMKSLAGNLNFNMDIRSPPNGELWGENMNGSFTGEAYNLIVNLILGVGLVGELQKERSDIGWADLFLIPDRMKYIDYTAPYQVEYASFMLG